MGGSLGDRVPNGGRYDIQQTGEEAIREAVRRAAMRRRGLRGPADSTAGRNRSVRGRGLGEGFHHEPGTAARDVRDDRRAAVQLGDAAEIDREGEYDLLALAQAEVRGFDEDAGRGEIDRLAQLAPTTGDGDVDD